MEIANLALNRLATLSLKREQSPNTSRKANFCLAFPLRLGQALPVQDRTKSTRSRPRGSALNGNQGTFYMPQRLRIFTAAAGPSLKPRWRKLGRHQIDAKPRPALDMLVALMLALAALFGLATPASVLAQDGAVPTGEPFFSQRVAIVISNQSYAQTDDIAFAAQDAEAFSLFASEVLGAQVHRFENLGTNRMRELFGDERRLGSLANFVLAPDTDLYIYYVGHGTHDSPSDPSLTQNYLLPTDANPDQKFLSDQALSLKDLQAALKNLQNNRLTKGRVTLVLESCFSGLSPSADGNQSSGLVRGVSAPPLGRAATVDLPDIRLWAATSPDTDFAVWDTEFQRGIFTDALMSALHDGKADLNGDFQVTAGEMRSAVTTTISRRLARLAASGQTSAFQQRPSFTGMDDDEVVLRYEGGVYPSYGLNQERAFIEAFRNDELMAAASQSLTSSDPKAIAETLDLLRSFSLTCEFCNEAEQRAALQAQINQLSARASACKVESDLQQSFLQSGALTRMSFLIERCECCPQKEQMQACVDSGQADSPACTCLAGQNCPEPGASENDSTQTASANEGQSGSLAGKQSGSQAGNQTGNQTGGQTGSGQTDEPPAVSPAFLAALDLMPNPSSCQDWDDFLNVWQNHPKAPDDLSEYQATRHTVCEVEQQVLRQRFDSELAALRFDGSCQQWRDFGDTWLAQLKSGELNFDITSELRRAEQLGQDACAREEQRASEDCLANALQSTNNKAALLRRCGARFASVPGLTQEVQRLIERFSCQGIDLNGNCLSREQAYRRLQLALSNTNCYQGNLDGQFSTATRAALADFSKATGQRLPVTSAQTLAQAITAVEQSAGFWVCQPAVTKRRCTIARVNNNIASISKYNHSSGRGFLAVRTGCTTRASQVGELYRGDLVEITGKEGSWYRVACIDGRCLTPKWGRPDPEGCSYGKYLTIVNTDARCD